MPRPAPLAPVAATRADRGDGDERETGSRSHRLGRAFRVAALFLLGLLLVQAAWLITTPPFRGIDEVDHAYRASSVADGHVLSPYRPVDPDRGRGFLIPVREDLAAAAHDQCRAIKYNGPANCEPGRRTGNEVQLASAAGRYNPAFYVVSGTVAKPFSGYAALYAMRIAGCTLCALLLVGTVWALVARCRSRWPLMFFLLALTPTTIYATSMAAPNGLNMVSGMAVWVALLGLYVGAEPPTVRMQRCLLALAGLGSVTLLMTHTLGIMWLGMIVVTVLALVGPRHVLARIHETPRAHLLSAGAALAALATAATWILLSRANDPSTEQPVTKASAFPEVLQGLVLWPLQAIAVFPTRTEPASPIVYSIALVLLVGFALLGITNADHRTRWVLVGAVVAAYLVPTVLTVLTYDRLGLAWQGRYGVPFTAGLYLMLGFALEHRRERATERRLMLIVVALLLTQNLLGMRGVIRRVLAEPLWQHNSHWQAPSLLVLATLCVLATVAWIRAVHLAGAPAS